MCNASQYDHRKNSSVTVKVIFSLLHCVKLAKSIYISMLHVSSAFCSFGSWNNLLLVIVIIFVYALCIVKSAKLMFCMPQTMYFTVCFSFIYFWGHMQSLFSERLKGSAIFSLRLLQTLINTCCTPDVLYHINLSHFWTIFFNSPKSIACSCDSCNCSRWLFP